jgi:hypothetical protein
MWWDIAGIVFTCVTMNHLGLVKAIEEFYDCELRIINCVKCFTYWSVLAYTIFVTHNIITSLAISFLASYSALWLELLEGYIDTLYYKLYEQIYSAKHSADDGA